MGGKGHFADFARPLGIADAVGVIGLRVDLRSRMMEHGRRILNVALALSGGLLDNGSVGNPTREASLKGPHLRP